MAAKPAASKGIIPVFIFPNSLIYIWNIVYNFNIACIYFTFFTI